MLRGPGDCADVRLMLDRCDPGAQRRWALARRTTGEPALWIQRRRFDATR
jgi:hypothetical protein